MFFKTRNRKRAEDLNLKVEKYRRWWQDKPGESSVGGSDPSEKGKSKQRPFDSSFVYHEEG